MIRYVKIALPLAALALTLGLQPALNGQDAKATTLETGTFHGKVHNTSGRATI